MSKHLVIGIDPGFTGAVAVFDRKADRITQVFDIPLLGKETTKQFFWRGPKGSDRLHIDIEALSDIFRLLAPDTLLASLEAGFPTPQMGVTSSWRYGFGCGLLEGILASFQIRTIHVKPMVWKPAAGLDRNKSNSLKSAIAKWPNMKPLLSRKQDHGRAEAMLLAEYGLRFCGERVEKVSKPEPSLSQFF